MRFQTVETHHRIAIVSDAWHPQINGVIRVLDTLGEQLVAMGNTVDFITPEQFQTVPCPSYPEIRLAVMAGPRMAKRLVELAPRAIHIATEGPLGIAARKWCLDNRRPFTTAYHTKFPEYVHMRTGIPLNWLYSAMRRFHAPSSSLLAPSASVYRELNSRGFVNVRQWSHGVDTEVFRPKGKNFLKLERPIHMFVGRVAPEKNLRAFLDLQLPGSKVVVGSGPQRDKLIRAYPDAHFKIAHGDEELSQYFSAADVFVFPSRTDTFGLTMIEALACGVPVAAFPTSGPLDVLGLSGPGETNAGCLDEDLARAAERALAKAPADCRARALAFPWTQVRDEFLAYLAPF
jgi:glycosyltransferase involved in cell wall biosynthesis